MSFPGRGGARLVVFDLDGTLVDSIGDIASSVNATLLERYGAGGALPIATVRGFVGGGARQLIERCLDSLRQPLTDLGPIFERFLDVYRARLVETTCLYPGMREALDEIGRHAPLAVLTNKPGDFSRTIVSKMGLEGRFIDVIGSDDLKTRKPDPEGLLRLAALAGAPIEETTLVGDSAVDVLTARNAGAMALGVLWGYDRAGVEQERPEFTARTPAEMARRLAATAGQYLSR